MAELLREEVDSPAELATLDELRSKAVHQKVILKLSSVKTMIAKTEGDNRTIGYFSSGREFVSALGEPFGEDPSDEEEPDDAEQRRATPDLLASRPRTRTRACP